MKEVNLMTGIAHAMGNLGGSGGGGGGQAGGSYMSLIFIAAVFVARPGIFGSSRTGLAVMTHRFLRRSGWPAAGFVAPP